METNFKVLMYNNEYVDTGLLENGIYSCVKPSLFSKDTTIESYEENIREIQGQYMILSEEYFRNLRKCELIDIKINF